MVDKGERYSQIVDLRAGQGGHNRASQPAQKESSLHELFDRTTRDIDLKLSEMGVGGRQRGLENLSVPGIFFGRDQLTTQVSRDLGLPENLSMIFVRDPDQPNGSNSVVVEIKRDYMSGIDRSYYYQGSGYYRSYRRSMEPTEDRRLYLTVGAMPKLRRPLVLPLPKVYSGLGLVVVEDIDIREPAVVFSDGNFCLGTNPGYSEREDVMLLVSKPESDGREVIASSVILEKDWRKLVGGGGRFMERYQIPVQQEYVQSAEEYELEQSLLNSPREALAQMKARINEFPDPPNLRSRDGAKVGRFGKEGRVRVLTNGEGVVSLMLENLQVSELAEQCYRGTLQPTTLEKCLHQTAEGDSPDKLQFTVFDLFGSCSVVVEVVRWDLGKGEYNPSKPYVVRLAAKPDFTFDNFTKALQTKLGTTGALAYIFNQIKPLEFRTGPKEPTRAGYLKAYGDRPVRLPRERVEGSRSWLEVRHDVYGC